MLLKGHPKKKQQRKGFFENNTVLNITWGLEHRPSKIGNSFPKQLFITLKCDNSEVEIRKDKKRKLAEAGSNQELEMCREAE